MDTETGQDRRAGGTVQPADQRRIARRTPRYPGAGEHFELRDPFAEVTYRAKTLPEMVLHAERLGALRFHVVAPDGTRTPVERLNGEWQRSAALEPQPQPANLSKGDSQLTTDARPSTPRHKELDSALARIYAEAAQSAKIERLERELNERYVIKRPSVKIGSFMIGQTEYRFRGDTARIAFTESTFRLATDNNNPSVARSMVDVADARHWNALRVSGHEEFRRMVWLEASLRGIDAIGYEPRQTDLELLRKELDARLVNRIEQVGVSHVVEDGGAATKPSGRGSGGRKAVLAALEAVLVAKRVPVRQREAVMAAAADNLAARLRKGEVHRVKVYDHSAPVQRPDVRPARDVERSRDRATPSR